MCQYGQALQSARSGLNSKVLPPSQLPVSERSRDTVHINAQCATWHTVASMPASEGGDLMTENASPSLSRAPVLCGADLRPPHQQWTSW